MISFSSNHHKNTFIRTKIMNTISTILSFFMVSLVSGECPIGWTNFGGSYCYLASMSRMTWGAAQEVWMKKSLNIKSFEEITVNFFSFVGAEVDIWLRSWMQKKNKDWIVICFMMSTIGWVLLMQLLKEPGDGRRHIRTWTTVTGILASQTTVTMKTA